MGRTVLRIRAVRVCLATTMVVGLVGVASAGAQTPHTVEAGESLWSIAAVNGMSMEDLAAANGLSPSAPLVAGATVQIPVVAGSSGAGTAAGSGACTWRCASTVHPHPTDEVVSAGQVGEVAAAQGMSSSLVQGMASLESGFDNSAVSSAGARGVMQIIPSTWEFIEDELVGHPLDAASAEANVEAGVTYLHYLYHLKGGDREATIASYFQGPNRDALLPETRRYVESVDQSQADLAASGG
jgi:N-acetylmuramoyl-L-alanine amidase